jgi:hypothetical protein
MGLSAHLGRCTWQQRERTAAGSALAGCAQPWCAGGRQRACCLPTPPTAARASGPPRHPVPFRTQPGGQSQYAGCAVRKKGRHWCQSAVAAWTSCFVGDGGERAFPSNTVTHRPCAGQWSQVMADAHSPGREKGRAAWGRVGQCHGGEHPKHHSRLQHLQHLHRHRHRHRCQHRPAGTGRSA